MASADGSFLRLPIGASGGFELGRDMGCRIVVLALDEPELFARVC